MYKVVLCVGRGRMLMVGFTTDTMDGIRKDHGIWMN